MAQPEAQNLSTRALIVQEALAKKGFHMKVVELPSSTRTAKDAAQSIGCEVAQIIKSLVFRTQDTKMPILILASGINQVNETAAANHVGEKLEKADATFVREKTGFAIGGIPPLGHKEKILTYIDADLLSFETLWATAGTPNAVFNLKSSELVNLTHGKVISIK